MVFIVTGGIFGNSGASNPGFWAADQLFAHNLGDFLTDKNLRKNGQNTDISLHSESSLGRTKMFLSRMLDAPEVVINQPTVNVL
jgi:hypothetical protein